MWEFAALVDESWSLSHLAHPFYQAAAPIMGILAVTNFNLVLSALGGWLVLFGLFSYWVKETLYLSDSRKHSCIREWSIPQLEFRPLPHPGLF